MYFVNQLGILEAHVFMVKQIIFLKLLAQQHTALTSIEKQSLAAQ